MGRLSGRGARSAERSTVSARLRSSRIVAAAIALSILPLAGVLTATPPSAIGAISTDYPSWASRVLIRATSAAAAFSSCWALATSSQLG